MSTRARRGETSPTPNAIPMTDAERAGAEKIARWLDLCDQKVEARNVRYAAGLPLEGVLLDNARPDPHVVPVGTYPALRATPEGDVVLFTSPDCGVLMHVGDYTREHHPSREPDRQIGTYSQKNYGSGGWNESYFSRPAHGEIKIDVHLGAVRTRFVPDREQVH